MDNETHRCESREGDYKYAQENVDLDFIVKTLFVEYKRLMQKLQKMTNGDRTYNKTIDALGKLSAVLRDFLKMKGIETDQEHIFDLLQKLDSTRKVEEVKE